MKRFVVCLAVLGALAHGLPAQGDVGARLVGRVSPEVVRFVSTLADSARGLGLPDAPLVDKALEGAAKSAAPDHIMAAVRTVFEQLSAAARVIRSTSADVGAQEIEAGAFALGAGLTGADIAAIAQTADATHPTMAVLQVGGALAALGVSPRQTVDLVRSAVRSGLPLGDLTNLPAQVQAAAANGVPPAAAAAGLERAAEARAAPNPHAGSKPKTNPHKP